MNPDDFVRIDASQNLTAAQQTQARKNIFAAPFDAMAYNGMQINGSMDVSQENGETLLTLVNTGDRYIIDGWRGSYTNSAAVVVGGKADSGLIGIPKCLFLRSNTGAAFSGAGDFAVLYTNIEGYRISRLGWGSASASSITIGFWIYAAVTGTFSVTVVNSGSNRSYVSNVTVNAVNAWEYKTVTVPGATTGLWDTVNGTGISVMFCFACGSTFRGPANTWNTGYFFASSSNTNFLAANSNQVLITGVVVLPGIEAPSAARSALIMRPYDQELLTCRRYFQTSYSSSVAVGTVSLAGSGNYYLDGLSSAVHAIFTCVPFGVPMRAAPSLYMYSPQTGAAGKIRDNGNAADVTGSPTNQGTSGFTFSAGAAAASTAANFMWHYVADARL